MARPRRKVYEMRTYLAKIGKDEIANDADTQRRPAWQPIIDGLVVTILNDDYISPLILSEEECGQMHIIDGGSRTAAFMMFRHMNYRIKRSAEDTLIKYKTNELNEDGERVWIEHEFDIKGKTFEQLPKNLQERFDEYLLETVVHECEMEEVSKYVKRYNLHSSMNANQKMFTYLPRFAKKIRKIGKSRFFIENNVILEKEKEKGKLERVIAETIMCMRYFDKWNKNGKNIASFLNTNATVEDFDLLESNLKRLENVITKETKVVFDSKDTFIWLTLFDKFTKVEADDTKFNDFISLFLNELKDKEVDGKTFYDCNTKSGTKDKKVVVAKLHILETLMNEFLHINIEDLKEVTPIEFIRENVQSDVEEADIETYSDMLEDCVMIDSPIYKKENLPSLLAMIAYGIKEDIDEDVCNWLTKYAKKATNFVAMQKKNYINMLQTFKRDKSIQSQKRTVCIA